MKETSGLYKYIPVFTKKDDTTVIYRVFENLSTRLFFVQSRDSLGSDLKNRELLEKQVLELFEEDIPENRSSGSASIVDAIKEFGKDFG